MNDETMKALVELKKTHLSKVAAVDHLLTPEVVTGNGAKSPELPTPKIVNGGNGKPPLRRRPDRKRNVGMGEAIREKLKEPGGWTAKGLAEALHSSPEAVKSAIHRLEKTGVEVSKSPMPPNGNRGRSELVYISPSH